MAGPDRIDVLDRKVLSDGWSVLARYRIAYHREDGTTQELTREVYERGHGAVILPYDPDRGTVLLARQFRLPVHLNGQDGFLIEAAAGLLEEADPAARIRAEAEEELGLTLTDVRQIWDVFMSPGAVTERLIFFVARYGAADRTGPGGGLEEEGEEITVMELPFRAALDMVDSGAIRDAKTIMLLQYAALNLFDLSAQEPQT